MTRGTFANVRIKNLMCPGIEGGYTQLLRRSVRCPRPTREIDRRAGARPTFIYDACRWPTKQQGTPLIVIGGEDYGMGSSRDWAAKGTRLLGVKAVITKSFERIHRSQPHRHGRAAAQLRRQGRLRQGNDLARRHLRPDRHRQRPQADAGGHPDRAPRRRQCIDVPLIVRIDTPVEIDYYRAGGILPYVLAQILAATA